MGSRIKGQPEGLMNGTSECRLWFPAVLTEAFL